MNKPKKTTLSEISWHGKNLAVWREKSFVDIDMGNEDLSGKSLYKINFTNWTGEFYDTLFLDCDMSYLEMHEVDMTATIIRNCNLEKAKIIVEQNSDGGGIDDCILKSTMIKINGFVFKKEGDENE